MYNNYNNPYFQSRFPSSIPQVQPQPVQQPVEQPQNNMVFNSVQTRSVLNGKQVDSIDVVKATDIPLDGSISYFPIADGSAIVTKQLGMDGTSRITVYKPIVEESKTVKYITDEDLKDIKSEIKSLKKQLKELKNTPDEEKEEE